MSRHQRKRRRRVRRRRRIDYLTGQLRTALEWRLRFREFPSLMDRSPHLRRLAGTMRQAEHTFINALERHGIRVTVQF